MDDGGLMVSTSDLRWSGQASFPRRGFTNLLFKYFVGSNDGIISGVAEMKDFMVKCEERPLEGGGYVRFL